MSPIVSVVSPSFPPVVSSRRFLPSFPPVVSSRRFLPSFPPVVSSRRFLPSFPPVVSSRRFLPSFPPVVSSRHFLPWGGNHDTTEDSISSLILSHKPVRGFPVISVVSPIVSIVSSRCFCYFPVVSHDTMGWKPRHHGGQHFQSNFKPQTSLWFPRRFRRFPLVVSVISSRRFPVISTAI